MKKRLCCMALLLLIPLVTACGTRSILSKINPFRRSSTDQYADASKMHHLYTAQYKTAKDDGKKLCNAGTLGEVPCAMLTVKEHDAQTAGKTASRMLDGWDASGRKRSAKPPGLDEQLTAFQKAVDDILAILPKTEEVQP